MENVLPFKPDVPIVTRQKFIEDVLAVGHADGSVMNLPTVLDAARSTAWREVNRIADSCCEHCWNATEQENFPIIDTVDPAARADLADAAALVVACDRLLADPAPTEDRAMMPATTLSTDEVIAALREAITAAGSQRTYAASIGISQPYLGDVLAGRRAAGDKILAALGLRRITVIAAVEDC